MRTIWKNQNHDKEDLTKQDLTNAYLGSCSFKGTKFGICTNAIFFKCDLPNADFTKAVLLGTDFRGSIMSNAQFPTATTLGQIASSLIDQFGLKAFFPTHSHEYIAEVFRQKSASITNAKIKTRATEAADYILAHYELSWQGLSSWLIAKYGKTFYQQMAEAVFDDRPKLLEKATQTLKEI